MKGRFLKRIIATVLGSVILCFACASPSYAASNRVFFGAGINFNDGYNRDLWINSLSSQISTIVKNKGYGGYQKVNQINASSALEILKNEAGIFAIHSHGTQTSVSFSNGTEITMSQINALSTNALSDVDLVIYGTCEAARGGKFASNIVNSTFRKGAKVVIGFQEKVYVNQMNHWLDSFFQSYSYGYDATQAAKESSDLVRLSNKNNGYGTDTYLIRY